MYKAKVKPAAYPKYLLFKATTILFLAWVVSLGQNVWAHNFSYLLTGEAVLLGIALVVVVNEENSLLSKLQRIAGLLHLVVSILLLVIYTDYMLYYINITLLRYWAIAQVIYLLLFILLIFQPKGKRMIVTIIAMLGAVAIGLIPVLSRTGYGDNSHLYQPMIYIGLYYLLVALLVKRYRKIA